MTDTELCEAVVRLLEELRAGQCPPPPVPRSLTWEAAVAELGGDRRVGQA